VAETVMIQGQTYLKRNPLGVLGLGFITLGIYFVYWFYKANQEIQRYTGDQTISPTRSLLAVFPGGIVIVPALIAFYNTANHVVQMEQQRGITSQISPAITVVIGLVFSIAVGIYVQEHLNRVWDSASAASSGPSATPPPPPSAPV